ncbi:hypothetical protein L1887_59325 [Cichorium endivia]|nr:hypothetical protein L1887_59325 [Cichorium endivia]
MDKGKARQIDPDRDGGASSRPAPRFAAHIQPAHLGHHRLSRGGLPHDLMPTLRTSRVCLLRSDARSKGRAVSKVILVVRPNVVADAQSGNNASGSKNESDANAADAYERFIFSLDYILPSSWSSMASSMTFHLLPRPKLGGGPDANTSTELTFAIVLEMNNEDTSPTGKDRNEPNTGDWIPADTEHLGRGQGARQQTPEGIDAAPKVRPIKTLDSGVINLMLYVEEDILAKSGASNGEPRPAKKRSEARPTSAQVSRRSGQVEEQLLHSKATQIDVSAAGRGGMHAREIKNRARRLDAERDLDPACTCRGGKRNPISHRPRTSASAHAWCWAKRAPPNPTPSPTRLHLTAPVAAVRVSATTMVTTSAVASSPPLNSTRGDAYKYILVDGVAMLVLVCACD